MQRSACRRVVSAVCRIGFLSFILIVCSPSIFSAGKRSNRILCRDDLSKPRREELATKLRAITGWDDLAFDQDGALQPGIKTTTFGSATARDLLTQALSGNQIVIIEDASNRQDVVFCRVVPGRWTNGENNNPRAYVLLIDFVDFDHLIGDKAALKSFDVGWGFLHEVDHVVNDSIDSDNPAELGECEAHINQMRRECGLPLRSEYFFKFFPHAEQSEFQTRLVRLAFDWEDPVSAKHRRYWVMWDANIVGGLKPSGLIAGLTR